MGQQNINTDLCVQKVKLHDRIAHKKAFYFIIIIIFAIAHFHCYPQMLNCNKRSSS